MLDQHGRTVTLTLSAAGAEYSMPGWRLILAARDDEKALEMAAMFDAPAVAPSPEKLRIVEIDEAIGNDSTVASLKAMTNAEFSAWFTANVTTLAQARNVLERLARIVIRRVL